MMGKIFITNRSDKEIVNNFILFKISKVKIIHLAFVIFADDFLENFLYCVNLN